MAIVELHLPIFDIKFSLLKGQAGLVQARDLLGEKSGFLDGFGPQVSGAVLMVPEGIDGFGEAVVLLNTRDLGVIAHECYHLAIDLIYWVLDEEPSYAHQETLAHVSEYLFRQIAREMGHPVAASAREITLDV